MNGIKERKKQTYAQEIKIVAQLKARDIDPVKLEKVDPAAATELSNVIGDLDEAGLMPEVERLTQELREQITKEASTTTPIQQQLSPKPHELKPIQPPLLQREDPEPALAVAHNPSRRAKVQRADVGHEETIRNQQWREDNYLPKKAPSWRELLTQFSHLTPEQISFLQECHFHPERFKKPNMRQRWVRNTIELMLFQLKQNNML